MIDLGVLDSLEPDRANEVQECSRAQGACFHRGHSYMSGTGQVCSKQSWRIPGSCPVTIDRNGISGVETHVCHGKIHTTWVCMHTHHLLHKSISPSHELIIIYLNHYDLFQNFLYQRVLLWTFLSLSLCP